MLALALKKFQQQEQWRTEHRLSISGRKEIDTSIKHFIQCNHNHNLWKTRNLFKKIKELTRMIETLRSNNRWALIKTNEINNKDIWKAFSHWNKHYFENRVWSNRVLQNRNKTMIRMHMDCMSVQQLYYNNMNYDRIGRNDSGTHIRGQHTNNFKYVDDTILLAESKVHYASEKNGKWKIQVNVNILSW